MVGTKGLGRELSDAGFEVHHDPAPVRPAATGARIDLPKYDAVIVGRCPHFDYDLLAIAHKFYNAE